MDFTAHTLADHLDIANIIFLYRLQNISSGIYFYKKKMDGWLMEPKPVGEKYQIDRPLEKVAAIDQFFNPRSVAVIGAAREEGKVGHVIFDNLIREFSGYVYPVNPKASSIHSHKCYSDISSIPGPIDLAVVVIPSKFVPSILEECGVAGVRSIVIISAGFKETGIEGAHLEQEALEIAEKHGIRFIGPNCLGIINTRNELNASFAAAVPEKGNIAFMSQSGALCTSILDWAKGERQGFSKFVSLGNKADVSETDLLQYWREDNLTDVITSYIEGIKNGREFLEVAREVSTKKPIIAIKAGSTEAGARAVSSHTGTLAGSENIYSAAFRQAGIVKADTVESLFDYALGFSNQPTPKGRKIAIVTNAGGPGVMATDACERADLQLSQFSFETIEGLKKILPDEASIYNPVDVLGDALSGRYKEATEIIIADKNVDSVLVVLTPQAMTEIKETAKALSEIRKVVDKPMFACFMGKSAVIPGIEILKNHRIPNYNFPERAINTIKAMVEWHEQKVKPKRKPTKYAVNRDKVQEIFDRSRSKRRFHLSETHALGVLDAYGIRTTKNKLAAEAREASDYAEEIGYPVALKIASPDILHKSDIGGIRLNIKNREELEESFENLIQDAVRYMPEAHIWGINVSEMITGAREVIIGVNRDPQFGHLIMFGLGGIYVEILKDVSFRITPVNKNEGEEMVNEIRSNLLLHGVRGQSRADIESIVGTIQRVSQLVTDFPEIVEMDINPLMVFDSGKGSVAADARISLGE